MRFKAIAAMTILISSAPIAYVNAVPIITQVPRSTSNVGTSDENKPKGMFSNIMVAGLYSYTDFNFNSTVGNNYNRFTGHSNLYGIGGDNVQLMKDLTAGLYIYKADTSVDASVFMSPGLPTTVGLTNHNYTLFGHVLKRLNDNYFFDLSGAIGQNKATSTTLMNTGAPGGLTGSATSRSGNWFVSAAAIYTKPWKKKFIVSANVRALYSQINADAYTMTFQPALPALAVTPITNKALFVMENAEVGYKFKPNVTPFVNAGLIQVSHYSNSRAVITAPINGSLPQLFMNRNGFKVGGGVGLSHKKLGIRIEEQYYNAHNSFTSWQTLVSLKYMMA